MNTREISRITEFEVEGIPYRVLTGHVITRECIYGACGHVTVVY